MNSVIKVENLSKIYQLGDFGTGTISRDLERFWARVRGKDDPFLKIGEINDRTKKGNGDVVWSLKDLNFEIKGGDAVGIIGRNGAGKSTLLKILSRVTAPSTGLIKVKGRIASLLEVGTGFHPELTGRENIYLNGAILGMRKKEIDRKFDEILDFSGVERYIDTPVKRYSSGMYVRLAFAVAAHLESEILIVDEVLAVGDTEFQKKCLGKMGDVSKGEGRTVLFVSHNMGSVRQLCSKGILLANGIIENKGAIGNIIAQYLSNQKQSTSYENLSTKVSIAYEAIQLIDETGACNNLFKHHDDIHINMKFKNFKANTYRTLITILDQYKNKIASSEAVILNPNMTVKLNGPFLTRGNYSLTCIIYIPGVTQFDYVEDCCNFEIVDGGSHFAHLADFDYGSTFGSFSWI